MSDATDHVCDCGHPRSEHEQMSVGLVCLHHDEPDGTPCPHCGDTGMCVGRFCSCAEFEEVEE